MRIEGWEKIFDEYIEEVSARPFEWGSCDCLIFVSDACLKICGKDPMSKKDSEDPDTIRGAYSTKHEAYSLIKKLRGSIYAIMDKHFQAVPVRFATRGDVVMAKLNEGKTFGLVTIKGPIFKTENGLILKKISDCCHAWRVE